MGIKWIKERYHLDYSGRRRTINLKSDFYHMNWGWSGAGMRSDNNNGWFKFDNLEINGITIKGENFNFQHKFT